MPLPRFYSARRFHRARLRDLRRAQRRALRDFAVLSDFAEIEAPPHGKLETIRLPDGSVLRLSEWIAVPAAPSQIEFLEVDPVARTFSYRFTGGQ